MRHRSDRRERGARPASGRERENRTRANQRVWGSGGGLPVPTHSGLRSPARTRTLAALTTEQIAGGTQALLDGDLSAADTVIENDDAVDDLTHSIEDRVFLLLARQQPIASDLRFLVTVMRVGHELERSADLMVNVAKTTRRLYPHQ